MQAEYIHRQTGLFSGVIGVKDDDGAYTVEPVQGQKKDEYVQQVTFADIAEYKPYTFSGCSSLSQITITGGEAEGQIHLPDITTIHKSLRRYRLNACKLGAVDGAGRIKLTPALQTLYNRVLAPVVPKSDGTYNAIEFYCEPDSAAAIYAGEYENIRITDRPDSTTFKVVFWNGADILDTQEVLVRPYPC